MSSEEQKLGRSFVWHNVTQFLGAMNDNIYKFLIIPFLVPESQADHATRIGAIAGAVFVVPFLLFTAFAGRLADRLSKTSIIRCVKVAELVIMCAAMAAFWFGSVWGLYLLLFAMSTQSAFFGPAKYGIIPELVGREKLSRANSFIEAMTYLAIIAGAFMAPTVLRLTGRNYVLAAAACVMVAAVGIGTSLGIKRMPSAGGGSKASVFFWNDIIKTLKSIKGDTSLLFAVFGAAYFLFFGAYIYVNLIPYGMEVLGLDKIASGYLFFIAALGIGVGSLLSSKLSGRHVELGVVPIGALGLGVSAIVLGLITDSRIAAYVWIFVMGASGGLFIIPLHAFIQLRSPEKNRGEVLAASGFIGWLGVLLASGAIGLVQLVNFGPAGSFVVLAVMTLLLTGLFIYKMPDLLVRFVAVMLTKCCYRVNTPGIEKVPFDGGALLVCNHVSYVDALLIGVTQQRRIRFVMDRDIYNLWWVNWFFRLMKVIPISPKDSPKRIVRSLHEARAAMDQGDLVCIFAEGAITRNGFVQKFRPGIEKIVKGTDCPIIPMYIGGAWGSIFSYYHGRVMSTLPRKFPYTVTIVFGDPMPSDSKAFDVRQRVVDLSCEYFADVKRKRQSMGYKFVQTARRKWFRHCMTDTTTGQRLTFGKALVSAVVLGRKIEKVTQGQKHVGIMLPPSAGGALANIACTMRGKIPVNLNYVTSGKNRDHCVEVCDVKKIITSHKFIRKLDTVEESDNMVFIEDMVKDVGWFDKFAGFVKAVLMPKKVLGCSEGFDPDSTATVIFSSGSSGMPKGVLLSHHNILSNIEQTKMLVKVRPGDNACCVLPIFHAFGYTCGLWLPLISGVPVVFIANPLDASTVGKAVEEDKSTLLFAPPTFLMRYMRRVEPEQFATLRFVAPGAEKLKMKMARSFEKKFGIKLHEGYGATEASPVISLNVDDVDRGGVEQVGHKDGTVGQPLPGVSVRIKHIETGEQLSAGEQGLITVKGPNVMQGYKDEPEKTRDVLQDGWYNTGDIGVLDEDGFLTIKDRLARFSKIGGEMVPHMGVEEVLMHGLDAHEQVVAVTGIPNEKKGEELVVLYLSDKTDADQLNEIISKSDVPNMWKPRADNYVPIDEMPILGSGKLDIVRVKELAREAKKDSSSVGV
ncbi:Bifunctional protein aas [Anaerohalosphaera lusitana]|uniref:Bifunctional protein aas n=1 Tax=Anaerohalosphaera lusitana TaxID=1936003 RepID=A0A1U9NKX7_9BACT|nr:acyl-[ACP]--phospholipid O-acyltransferase [Anaerohalosphaera lusitana]AQT68166.1 Bifunctional protein aas [Anaerohalosphaera lusitana]